MKKILFLVLIAMAAFLLAACEPPPAANTANTNANANTARPTAAAPTADALMAMDRQATEAWMKGDAKFFEDFLHDKFVMYEMGQQVSKSDLLKMVADNKCDVKTWDLADPQMAKIDNDTYVVSYRGTFDGTCTGPDGKAMTLPNPVRAASVYVRSGEKWLGAFHGETPIIDPKNPPAAAPAPSEKKEEPKKDDSGSANTASNMNTNTAEPAKPASSANTDALVRRHTEGWEAWKAKDAKKLTDMTTANLAIVDPMGNWISGQNAVVTYWTETMKCEGVNNVRLSDGMSTALSPTVEILTVKGWADGTCDGQKNGTLHQTAVFVKEGNDWKLAFMFESPAM